MIFPLLFRYCFIHVSLAYVVSSLAYLYLLGTKRLGCCCCIFFLNNMIEFKYQSWFEYFIEFI
jgi:hypothetical protein